MDCLSNERPNSSPLGKNELGKKEFALNVAEKVIIGQIVKSRRNLMLPEPGMGKRNRTMFNFQMIRSCAFWDIVNSILNCQNGLNPSELQLLICMLNLMLYLN